MLAQGCGGGGGGPWASRLRRMGGWRGDFFWGWSGKASGPVRGDGGHVGGVPACCDWRVGGISEGFPARVVCSNSACLRL